MTIQIRKASRKKAKLRLGITGPSGAGKTLGSLLIAYGIKKDWDKIGVIDTEEGSGELYVGVTKHGVTIGEFQYIRISKDFSPINYINAIKAFEQAGVEVIIIDSLTHAWTGTDGLLDKQGKIAAKTNNSYTAWRDVTPQHNALVNAMLQSTCHIIGTMRSKVEYAMQDGDNGKKKVVKLGMAPIQREGMEYEFTTFFDIASNSIATTTKDRTDLFSTINAAGVLEKRDFIVTPQIGEELLSWLNTGNDVPPPEPEPENPLIEEIRLLFDTVRLDESPQAKWIEENIVNIGNYPDKLDKVYDYLKQQTIKE